MSHLAVSTSTIIKQQNVIFNFWGVFCFRVRKNQKRSGFLLLLVSSLVRLSVVSAWELKDKKSPDKGIMPSLVHQKNKISWFELGFLGNLWEKLPFFQKPNTTTAVFLDLSETNLSMLQQDHLVW